MGEENTMQKRTRPLTRQYRKALEQQEKNDSEPRRSKRDHHSIRLHGTTAFHKRLKALFFEPKNNDMRKPPIGSRLALHRLQCDPHIYEIPGFLTEPELEYFRNFVKTCVFQKSFVDNMDFDAEKREDDPPGRRKRTIVDTSHRTSTFYEFRPRENSTIRTIEQRTADLLCVLPHQIEGLQLVRYQPGQFFGVHHDMGDLQEDGEVARPPKNHIVKRRLVTLFVYLNNLAEHEGGCTWFPVCNDLRVSPEQGKALLWSNVLADGYPDPRTVHAGEQVIGGKGVMKYGLNIWVTEE